MSASPRIDSVWTQLVALALDEWIGGAAGRLTTLDYLLVQLRSSDGVVGTGHTFGLFEGEISAVHALARRLAPQLVGCDPLCVERIWRRLRAQLQDSEIRPGAAALSAIDVGVWDLQGRLLGQPVYKLLGGNAASVAVYASHDLWEGLAPDALARNASALVADGFHALKIRTGGSRDPRREAHRLEAVRASIGPDVEVMYDALQSYTAEEAIAIGRALEPHGLTWLEDPVEESDLGACARVAAELDVPVASGENLVLPEGFAPAIEQRAVDFAMLDLKWIGGITPWRRVAAHAEAAGMPVVSHLQTQVSAHALAGLGGGRWLEYMPWGLELFAEAPALRDGVWLLGEAPGLGLTLRPEYARWERAA